METTLVHPHDLPYAQAAPSYGHKIFAGIAILMAGLGLIVLGGCFLIGVMLITNHGFNAVPAAATLPLTTAAFIEVAVLYTLAGISFAGASLVLLAGLRALLRVMRS